MLSDPDRPESLASPLLAGLSGVSHAFFTRRGGVSAGLYASLNGGLGSADERAHVVENRARMAAWFGLQPDRLIGVWQVHSPTAVAVRGVWPGAERPQADAMVTATPGLALGISTADCGPLLFADPIARVIGAAHAGWKGAFSGVIEATLDRMVEHGARPSAIRVAIGPMLSQANYEVGPEFVARFVGADPDTADLFAPSQKAGHAMFDLPRYVRRRLSVAGIVHVHDLALCTYADEARFFSYRRATHRGEADYGRLIAAIALT